MTGLRRFIQKNPAALALGFSHTFFSGYGQTFFISLFVPYLMDSTGYSRALFSSLYLIATLTSAAVTPLAGPWIDRKPMNRISLLNGAVLLGGSLLAVLSDSVFMLVPALFLLRFSGQGMMTHIAHTLMGRFFTTNRGKALSICNMGYPLSEATLPWLAAALISAGTWRSGYGGMILILSAVYFPAVLLLYRRVPAIASPEARAVGEQEVTLHSTRGEALREPYLWTILPAAVIAPFVNTALFFHNDALSSIHQWNPSLLATGFTFFALFRAAGAFGAGPLVDRFSGVSLFPFHILPMAAGLWFLASGTSPQTSWIFFAAAGLTTGLGSNLKSALLAERYGTRHLGAIRSVVSSALIFSTAVSPFLMGAFLDRGVTLAAIARGAAGLTLIAAAAAALGTLRFRRF
ncbi:MAG: MFS transporter [Fibrobacterota bacterium]